MGSGTATSEGTCRARGTLRLCCGAGKPPGALTLSYHFPSLCLLSCRLLDFHGEFLGEVLSLNSLTFQAIYILRMGSMLAALILFLNRFMYRPAGR